MTARTATVTRKTAETDIRLTIAVDGRGSVELSTPVPFFNHMLTVWAKNALVDLSVQATGDIGVEAHHIIEDTGLCLGMALNRALGDKRGITRYGFFILPMDEAVTTSVIDLSGRFTFSLDCPFVRTEIGGMPTELVYDFWQAVAAGTPMNLWIRTQDGRNDHHKAESVFKSVGRAMRMACAPDPALGNDIPSTKGIL